MKNTHKRHIVVVGNGMVGHKFCERLLEYDTADTFEIMVFGEEILPAYDRVQLTSYFEHYDENQLIIQEKEWYASNGITLHLGDRIASIDPSGHTVTSSKGVIAPYDKLILCTGSSAFVPPLPGVEKNGVFVYRTIEHLDAIKAYAATVTSAAVIGGGLLGLEAAKACAELGLKTTILERNDRLMPRQLDRRGGQLLLSNINALGIEVITSAFTTEFIGNGKFEGIAFDNGDTKPYDMVVISAGISPNDQLGRDASLEVADRGGIVVNEKLQTSNQDIFAIGECANFKGMVYGLVAPGFDMADVLAANFCGDDRSFQKADMSTKLKLMGVDVASLGDPFYAADSKVVEFHDTHKGVYKKLVMCPDGRTLRGAILVGDAADYGPISLYVKNGKELPESPEALIVGGIGGLSLDSLSDEDTVCSCNNVTKGGLCAAIADGTTNLNELKACTKAGTGCGGCLQMTKSILNAELEKLGIASDTSICEHFKYSRQDLFQIVKIKELKTFGDVLASHGTGYGCEICKTTVASILSSLWNDEVQSHDQILDTNDRYLANIQRNGTYSVIPRSPGGELTPEQMIVMGQVAQEYTLYTKLTGSQRVAMFGAHVNDLPDIWKRLNAVGLESGHAYAKGLRMVKSCVGSTWCRFGVQPSVDFAIELENRYKGMRSPHKLKAAVSGCTRECAEAMSKDFGLIATEKGYNLYVCGNGGTYPRHADLLASDLDPETATTYIDRFLMYYIMTADKLQRTATWMNELEGGIETLKEVVINDSLGIGDALEAGMKRIIDSQHDEWAMTVADKEQVKRFKHFSNADDRDAYTRNIVARTQEKPMLWEKDYAVAEVNEDAQHAPRTWVKLGKTSEIPVDGGRALKYGRHQIAVFNFASMGRWYATQNLCPHKREMVLARGIIGDLNGVPKVACPMHKKSFSLEDGSSVTGEDYTIQTFDIQVDGDDISVLLPEEAILDQLYVCEPAKRRSGAPQEQDAEACDSRG